MYSYIFQNYKQSVFTNHTDYLSILQLLGHRYRSYNFQIITNFTVYLGCIDLRKYGENTGIGNWFDLFIF